MSIHHQGVIAAQRPAVVLSRGATVTTPPTGDTTPPVFVGGPSVSQITTTSAVIGCQTNEPGTSRVEYGLTQGFGQMTQLLDVNPLVTIHSVPVTGLTPASTYYFRFRTFDAAGNEAISQTLTFQTPSVGGGGGGGSQGTFAFTNNGPDLGNTGPRGSFISTQPGGTLQPNTYIGIRFTSTVIFGSTSGTYNFVDCEMPDFRSPGVTSVWGLNGVTRVVNLYHCRVRGIFFEYGGHKDWSIRGCFIGDPVGTPVGQGSKQALRPKKQLSTSTEAEDMTSPTPMLVEDSYLRIVGYSGSSGHEEACQILGGSGYTFRRVTFDTYSPAGPNTTATMTIIGSNALFDHCNFIQRGCAVYMVYASGYNGVTFDTPRISRGTGNYIYPGPYVYPRAVYQNATDYDTGAALTLS